MAKEAAGLLERYTDAGLAQTLLTAAERSASVAVTPRNQERAIGEELTSNLKSSRSFACWPPGCRDARSASGCTSRSLP